MGQVCWTQYPNGHPVERSISFSAPWLWEELAGEDAHGAADVNGHRGPQGLPRQTVAAKEAPAPRVLNAQSLQVFSGHTLNDS